MTKLSLANLWIHAGHSMDFSPVKSQMGELRSHILLFGGTKIVEK